MFFEHDSYQFNVCCWNTCFYKLFFTSCFDCPRVPWSSLRFESSLYSSFWDFRFEFNKIRVTRIQCPHALILICWVCRVICCWSKVYNSVGTRRWIILIYQLILFSPASYLHCQIWSDGKPGIALLWHWNLYLRVETLPWYHF